MWQPDQLEAESARGCWVAVSPPPALRHPQVGGCRIREKEAQQFGRSQQWRSSFAVADCCKTSRRIRRVDLTCAQQV